MFIDVFIEGFIEGFIDVFIDVFIEIEMADQVCKILHIQLKQKTNTIIALSVNMNTNYYYDAVITKEF